MNPLTVLTGLSFKSLLHGRRLLLPILLGLVPVLVSIALIWVRARFSIPTLTPEALYRFLATDYFHLFLVLSAMVFGTSAVADDAEDGSVVYLLVRPIRRGLVYLGKVTAAALATLLAVAPTLILTWLLLVVAGGAQRLAPSLLARDLLWLVLGSIAYPAAFAAAAAFGRRPLQVAVAYLFVWEFPMAFAPTSLRFLTVSHYVLSLMPHTSWWNSVVTTFGMSTPVPVALAGLVAMAVVLLVVGSVRFERREHLPTAGA